MPGSIPCEKERKILRTGDVVGDWFEVEHLAGAGGMGAVWRARDRRTGRHVALKVLAESHAGHARRFLREASLLAELDHPAIVGHVAHGTERNGLPWLAMRWLDGEELAARLARGTLEPEQVAGLGARLCEALAILHARAVVHRDIKPHNVFLEDGDPSRVVLLDLGVGRTFDGTGRITSTNEVVGTVGYLAPEQVEETEE